MEVEGTWTRLLLACVALAFHPERFMFRWLTEQTKHAGVRRETPMRPTSARLA